MGEPKESKYVAKLQELGFGPVAEEESAYMEQRIELRIKEIREIVALRGRQERRKAEVIIAKLLVQPKFFTCPSPDATYARDEMGRWWYTEGHVDLTFIKFSNLNQFAILGSFLSPLQKSKLH